MNNKPTTTLREQIRQIFKKYVTMPPLDEPSPHREILDEQIVPEFEALLNSAIDKKVDEERERIITHLYSLKADVSYSRTEIINYIEESLPHAEKETV